VTRTGGPAGLDESFDEFVHQHQQSLARAVVRSAGIRFSVNHSHRYPASFSQALRRALSRCSRWLYGRCGRRSAASAGRAPCASRPPSAPNAGGPLMGPGLVCQESPASHSAAWMLPPGVIDQPTIRPCTLIDAAPLYRVPDDREPRSTTEPSGAQRRAAVAPPAAYASPTITPRSLMPPLSARK